jgi:hypothetical protein
MCPQRGNFFAFVSIVVAIASIVVKKTDIFRRKSRPPDCGRDAVAAKKNGVPLHRREKAKMQKK